MTVRHPEWTHALPVANAVLTRPAIEAALGPHGARFAVRLLDRCASTNAELQAEQPPADGNIVVCVTREQTAGRGRRGRNWLAWRDHGLTFSCLYVWPRNAPAPSGLSLAVGLGIALGLEELGLASARLKWPNDVLVDGHKLAGILIELNGQSVVIGVGLNMRLPDEASGELDRATALDRHLTPLPPPAVVLATLLRHIALVCDRFALDGLSSLRKPWMQRHAFHECGVRIIGECGEREGVCEGIDHDGALLLRHADGRLERVVSGDVSLREAA